VNECNHWLLMEWFQYLYQHGMNMKATNGEKHVCYKHVQEICPGSHYVYIHTHIHTNNCTDVNWLYTMCGNPPTYFALCWPSSGRYWTKKNVLIASCNWYVQILQLNCRILKLNQELKYLYMKELPFYYSAF